MGDLFGIYLGAPC